jgi:hypothetical protein
MVVLKGRHFVTFLQDCLDVLLHRIHSLLWLEGNDIG